MSNKKRNIAYIKPEEPNFLKRLKQEIGYKEGTTIETKRQEMSDGPEDLQEADDSENPQVVVLQEGDLTEQQAAAEKLRLDKEEQEKPADLNQRVVFKPRSKPPAEPDISETKSSNNDKPSRSQKSTGKSGKKEKPKPILSFQDDDDED